MAAETAQNQISHVRRIARTMDVFLVIGGSGFLGRHIVQQLLDRGDVVHVFDIVQRYHDVPFHSGDINDQASLEAALQIVPLSLFPFNPLLVPPRRAEQRA